MNWSNNSDISCYIRICWHCRAGLKIFTVLDHLKWLALIPSWALIVCWLNRSVSCRSLSSALSPFPGRGVKKSKVARHLPQPILLLRIPMRGPTKFIQTHSGRRPPSLWVCSSRQLRFTSRGVTRSLSTTLSVWCSVLVLNPRICSSWWRSISCLHGYGYLQMLSERVVIPGCEKGFEKLYRVSKIGID